MKHLLLSSLSLLGAMASAQVVHFPMEVNDNQITEQCKNRSFTVNGKRDAISVPGAVGQALRADGYSTFVEADVDAASINGDATTFELWLAAETYPMMNIDEDKNDYATIAGTLDNNAKTGFAFQLSNRGNWRFECYAGSGSEFNLEAPALLPKRQWCHLVATVDATNRLLTLYLNGQQVAQNTMRRGINVGTSTMMIGKSREDVTSNGILLNTFNGIIDEVTVYNKVMSAAEIKTLSETSDLACGSRADLSTPASAFADDQLRPRFHGMPSAGWTNESHGLVYSDGRWHVFFQKNGNGPYMSRLHWGHIASENLYDWEELPIAIDPAETYDVKGCWSGCLAVDEQVFGTSLPTIIYTGVDYVKASINVATPADASLLDWQKQSNNPRIAQRPSGLSDDFRDPYFFRTEQGAYIIVGSSKNGVGCCTLHKYNEATKTWSNDGSIFFQGTSANTCGTFWEMPNITQIDEDRWLFTVTPQKIGNNVGVRLLYWVGSIDKDGKFVPSKKQSWPLSVEMSGMSRDGYGLLSPSITQHEGKTIALGIVPDKVATSYNLDWGWAHCYSLPREWSLSDDDCLIQRPYSGLQGLRSSENAYSHRSFTLNGAESFTNVTGRQVEVRATFEVGTADFGLDLLQSGDKSLRISYAPATGTVSVDATKLERISNDGSAFKGVYSHTLASRPATGSDVTLHAFFDGSVLDLFVNDEQAASIRIFATDAEAAGLSIFSTAPTSVRDVQAWVLSSDNTPSGIEQISFGLEGKSKDSNVLYELNEYTRQLEIIQILPDGKRRRVF